MMARAQFSVLQMLQRVPEVAEECSGESIVNPGKGDFQFSFWISVTLGVPSFLAFCVLRTRWPALYAARIRKVDGLAGLPALPNGLFGWIPVLYRITDAEVLAFGGLDAYVFLTFFKMAAQILSIMLFFAVTVLLPINNAMFSAPGMPKEPRSLHTIGSEGPQDDRDDRDDGPIWGGMQCKDLANSGHERVSGAKLRVFTWSYLFFTYFFTGIVLAMVNRHTRKILQVRQEYLGSQTTITDRTFRITGIPPELKDEGKIKELVEKLGIGKVIDVTLARKWNGIDQLVHDRDHALQQLERYCTMARSAFCRSTGEDAPEPSYIPRLYRPITRVWFGPLHLVTRKVDAIDYWQTQLALLDTRVLAARAAYYPPADLAFVTMSTTTACQMAIQALMDPRPGVLLTNPAPSPADVVWHNTYASRNLRRAKSWVVTGLISVLSVFWLFIVAAVASMLSLCTIKKMAPGLGEAIERHPWLGAAVQSGVPVLVVTTLNALVPLLYEWLSYRQGMVSRDEIELSFVSKNFFFTFFNVFFVFTFAGSFSQVLPCLREALSNISVASQLLAASTLKLSGFYICFITLQTLGLAPFRLLEPGGVASYLRGRLLAKSPRDLHNLAQPPQFSSGYYLPTALLIFLLSLVYSILPLGSLILLIGTIYFLLSLYIYKYQLLYAMTQPQHATGGAWRTVCNRAFLAVFVFQTIMAGVIGLQGTWKVAPMVVPAMGGTAWYAVYFWRCYVPLMRFISLASVRQDRPASRNLVDVVAGETTHLAGLSGTSGGGGLENGILTVVNSRGLNSKFENPSLTKTLERPWIKHRDSGVVSVDGSPDISPRSSEEAGEAGPHFVDRIEPYHDELAGLVPVTRDIPRSPSRTDSTISWGDTHVWRDA